MWSWYILISSCYFCHTFNARLLVVIAKKLMVKSCKWFVFFQTTVISLPAQLLQKTGIFVCIITHTQLFNGSSFRDYMGGPVPEETFTHSHPSWSSDIFCQLPPSTMIHNILFVQFPYLTVLSTQPLSRTSLVFSCTGALYFIRHTFLHPIIIFSQHMPVPSQPVLPVLCHLFLISLSAPYLEISLIP